MKVNLVFRQESGHFKIRLFYSKSYRTAFGGALETINPKAD